VSTYRFKHEKKHKSRFVESHGVIVRGAVVGMTQVAYAAVKKLNRTLHCLTHL